MGNLQFSSGKTVARLMAMGFSNWIEGWSNIRGWYWITNTLDNKHSGAPEKGFDVVGFYEYKTQG